MQIPCKIYKLESTDTIQTIHIKYTPDKKPHEGQAVLANERMQLVINITSVGPMNFIAETTASLYNIRILTSMPYMLHQD